MKAKEWDWNWDSTDGMHHIPGIRIKDFDHFLPYEYLDGAAIIISLGRKEKLKCEEKSIAQHL